MAYVCACREGGERDRGDWVCCEGSHSDNATRHIYKRKSRESVRQLDVHSDQRRRIMRDRWPFRSKHKSSTQRNKKRGRSKINQKNQEKRTNPPIILLLNSNQLSLAFIPRSEELGGRRGADEAGVGDACEADALWGSRGEWGVLVEEREGLGEWDVRVGVG